MVHTRNTRECTHAEHINYDYNNDGDGFARAAGRFHALTQQQYVVTMCIPTCNIWMHVYCVLYIYLLWREIIYNAISSAYDPANGVRGTGTHENRPTVHNTDSRITQKTRKIEKQTDAGEKRAIHIGRIIIYIIFVRELHVSISSNKLLRHRHHAWVLQQRYNI